MNRFLPILAFLALVAIMSWGLLVREDRDALPSAFLSKPAPEFSIPHMTGDGTLTAADLKGDGPVVLNFWASWCAPCRVEHPELMQLQAMGVRVIGINYKDDDAKAQAFLDQLGNPFEAIGDDDKGRAAIEFGVVALPETFVIDGDGTIVYKHTGPINPGELDEKVWPAIRAASK